MLDWSHVGHGGRTPPNVQSLLIVARDQLDLWRALVQEFQDAEDIRILLDRRAGERRTARSPVASERRASERRSLPRLEANPHARQHVLFRLHYRRAHD